MNTLLINLDLATPDFYQDMSSLLECGNLSIITYVDGGNELVFMRDGWSLSEAIHFNSENLTSLISVAPGVVTLKFLHELATLELKKGDDKLALVIYLPEFWMIQKLEKINPFMFEAFYSYLSAVLSIGYPHFLIACSSIVSAEYYASSMLGGFLPKVASIENICNELGIIKHIPMGVG